MTDSPAYTPLADALLAGQLLDAWVEDWRRQGIIEDRWSAERAWRRSDRRTTTGDSYSPIDGSPRREPTADRSFRADRHAWQYVA